MALRHVGATAVAFALAVWVMDPPARADVDGEDAAAEATLLAAVQSARAGDLASAATAYQRFVDAFGGEAVLVALERADRRRAAARVRQLKAAYEQLRACRLWVLDFRGASEISAAIAGQARFSTSDRREAAFDVAAFSSANGDEERARAAAAIFAKLGPAEGERAEVDFAVANLSCADASTHATRQRCARAMTRFHDAYRRSAGAERRVVDAAHRAASAMRVDRDPQAPEWCRRTIAAFERYRARQSSSIGAAESDFAAECALSAIDERFRKPLDDDTLFARYAGKPDVILGRVDEDLRTIATYAKELEDAGARFLSTTYYAVGRARAGARYDTVRTRLAYARVNEPVAGGSGFDDCWGSKDWNHPAVPTPWQTGRRARLDAAEALMIPLYARAAVAARAWHASSAEIDRAVRRLGFFEEILGAQRFSLLVQGVEDPATKKPFVYEAGMFSRARSGRLLAVDIEALPLPMPYPG